MLNQPCLTFQLNTLHSLQSAFTEAHSYVRYHPSRGYNWQFKETDENSKWKSTNLQSQISTNMQSKPVISQSADSKCWILASTWQVTLPLPEWLRQCVSNNNCILTQIGLSRGLTIIWFRLYCMYENILEKGSVWCQSKIQCMVYVQNTVIEAISNF